MQNKKKIDVNKEKQSKVVIEMLDPSEFRVVTGGVVGAESGPVAIGKDIGSVGGGTIFAAK